MRRTTVGSSVKKKWPAQFESKVFDRVFNRHFDILQLPQAAEMEGSSRGGAVMARGGRHGDQRRLDDFMHDSEGWGNAEGRPLSAEQMEAEDEMSASE